MIWQEVLDSEDPQSSSKRRTCKPNVYKTTLLYNRMYNIITP